VVSDEPKENPITRAKRLAAAINKQQKKYHDEHAETREQRRKRIMNTPSAWNRIA
jgi:F0F1-type ATP synthase membrane subunit b/b'